MKTITWKDVLDYNAPDAEHYGHIDEFLPVVKKAGYRYYSWNERVYEMHEGNNFTDTGIMAHELPATIKPNLLQKALDELDGGHLLRSCDTRTTWVKLEHAKDTMRTLAEELEQQS